MFFRLTLLGGVGGAPVWGQSSSLVYQRGTRGSGAQDIWLKTFAARVTGISAAHHVLCREEEIKKEPFHEDTEERV